jgi:hypothetical protein
MIRGFGDIAIRWWIAMLQRTGEQRTGARNLQSLCKRRLLPGLYEAVRGPREDSLCHLARENVYHLPIRTHGA